MHIVSVQPLPHISSTHPMDSPQYLHSFSCRTFWPPILTRAPISSCPSSILHILPSLMAVLKNVILALLRALGDAVRVSHERATQISLNTWSPGSRKENSRKVSVSDPMCYGPVWQVLASAIRYRLPHCFLHLNWASWLAQIYHVETGISNYTTRNYKAPKISVCKTPS